MNTWFRKVGVGALALTLAGVLGGCNNGNGGGALIRLYFGMLGSGNCSSVIVEVDLEDADAILARDSEGAPQCDLNSSLASSGCNLSLSELANGNLRAVISGCTIPAVTNLFSCLFEDVDISELQETAFGQCTCVTPGCDTTPPICIGTSPDPRACEDCDNGVDDDGDGLTDCDDPKCENDPACQDVTTTSTTSTSLPGDSTTSSTTTTTSSSTTTSTTLVARLDCKIVLATNTPATFGALQFDVDYSDVPGFPVGDGGAVNCASRVEGALFEKNNKSSQELITMGFVDLQGFSGPTDLADCQFKAFVPPTPGDFTITVTDAFDPNLAPIQDASVIVKGGIECEGTGPTTTTTEHVVTTTTVDGPAQDFDIQIKLDSSSTGLGALQVLISYKDANGGFAGSGQGVLCTNQVGGGIPAFNDRDETNTPENDPKFRSLTLGYIALAPIVAPTNLALCTFNGGPGAAPVPADFDIIVEDAADVLSEPVPVESVNVSLTVTPKP